jgi:splicing factor 3B subunit 3
MITTYSTMDKETKVYFNPRSLKFLSCCDEVPSLCSISDMVIEDLISDGMPQIYTLCGRGSRSSLRILKQGMAVTEVASSSLPGKPISIWTVKSDAGDKFDKYAIVSFQNSTLVLSIEETVKEVHDSGFDLKKPSLYVASLVDNTFIQVLPNGIIHIKSDKKKALYQTSSKIISASSNNKQIAVALQDREILYFEAQGDKLEKVESKVLDSEIVSISMGEIPENRNRAKYLAVGCSDNTVRILSLQIDQCLSKVSTQVLPALPESILLTELDQTSEDSTSLYLFVGLNNGVLMKTAVDPFTGTMSDTRTRYLGSRGVNLFKVQVQNKPAVLANSTKPWLCYNYMNKYYCTSLNNESIESAASLISPQCSEGIVCICGNNFTIFTIDQYGEIFHQNVVPLRYTPRKLLVNPENNNLIIVESDQNVMSKREKDLYKKDIAEKTNDSEYLKLKEDHIGVPFVGEGRWASCVRMIEPYEHKVLDLIEFEDNEAAFSATIMTFSSTPGEMFLIIGTAKDMKLHPRSFTSSSIIVFAFKDGGKKIEYLHRVNLINLDTC